MVSTDSLFFQRSRQVAEKFLQTVVIIDDRAEFNPPSLGTHNDLENPATVEKLKIPASMSRGLLEESTDEVEEAMPSGGDDSIAHSLYAQQVINSFAAKGIVCSVIKPNADMDLIPVVKKLALASDIIVLDWDLHGDDGEKALEILTYLSNKANSIPEQLRLFAVYTGATDIAGILERITNGLGLPFHEGNPDFSISINSVHVIVISKPDSLIAPEYRHRQVPFEELPQRIIREFASVTAGLASNVVMAALTELRENSSKILQKFSQDVDAPYLTHRALQETPEDAEELIISLVAEELKAILHEKAVGKKADISSVSDWLKMHDRQTFQLTSDIEIGMDDLLELMQVGFKNWKYSRQNMPGRKKFSAQLTKAMIPPHLKEQDYSDDRFAALTTMRSFYDGASKAVTLGTILRRQIQITEKVSENGVVRDEVKLVEQYILCLQPVCDTVRLTGARLFPFIPLIPTSISNSSFNIVVWDRNHSKYMRLLASDKPYDLILVNFKPTDTDRIVVTQTDPHVNDTDGKRYEWIGELRREHAIRVSQAFANSMSRVGVDESEWLRLGSGS